MSKSSKSVSFSSKSSAGIKSGTSSPLSSASNSSAGSGSGNHGKGILKNISTSSNSPRSVSTNHSSHPAPLSEVPKSQSWFGGLSDLQNNSFIQEVFSLVNNNIVKPVASQVEEIGKSFEEIGRGLDSILPSDSKSGNYSPTGSSQSPLSSSPNSSGKGGRSSGGSSGDISIRGSKFQSTENTAGKSHNLEFTIRSTDYFPGKASPFLDKSGKTVSELKITKKYFEAFIKKQIGGGVHAVGGVTMFISEATKKEGRAIHSLQDATSVGKAVDYITNNLSQQQFDLLKEYVVKQKINDNLKEQVDNGGYEKRFQKNKRKILQHIEIDTQAQAKLYNATARQQRSSYPEIYDGEFRIAKSQLECVRAKQMPQEFPEFKEVKTLIARNNELLCKNVDKTLSQKIKNLHRQFQSEKTPSPSPRSSSATSLSSLGRSQSFSGGGSRNREGIAFFRTKSYNDASDNGSRGSSSSSHHLR